jgi:hypothetical protein
MCLISLSIYSIPYSIISSTLCGGSLLPSKKKKKIIVFFLFLRILIIFYPQISIILKHKNFQSIKMKQRNPILFQFLDI